MSMETLKTLRIIIPGMMFLLVSLPLFFPEQLDTETILGFLGDVKGLAQITIVAVLGSLYYVLDVREQVLRDYRRKTEDNIQTKLLGFFEDDLVISNASEKLKEGELLFDVFYEIIDNDKSLTQRANIVRLNGLIWSSSADLAIISLLAADIYGIAYIFTHKQNFLYLLGVLIVVYLISRFLLLRLLTKKQIKLTQRQFDFIYAHHLDKLKEKLTRLAQRQKPPHVSPQ